MADDKEPERRPRVLVSDPISFTLDAVTAFGFREGELRAKSPGGIDQATRLEMIESVRVGKQIELEVPAITFRQETGKPNRNGFRFSTKRLGKIAKSFGGKPMLVDHRSWMQSARIGTILSSELVDGKLDTDPGGAAFRQVFRVVKPEAVISVLDGTIDRFSVGWDATGPVICTAHKCEVFTECSCWPLETVTIDNQPVIVEYEFTAAEGDETSSVNTPAVTGTKIEDVRAALAAELRITPTRKAQQMPFPRLAAALALAQLSDDADEGRAVAAVQTINTRLVALESERDLYRTRALEAEGTLATTRTELAAATATKLAAEIDSVIESAYNSGRLAIKRDAAGKRIESKVEAQLRVHGKTLGAKALGDYVEEMPVIVPVGQKPIAEGVGEMPRTEFTVGAPEATALDSVATQLGLDPKTVAENATKLAGSRRNIIQFERGPSAPPAPVK